MTADRSLIALDWGTSSLRAALMAPDGTIEDRLSSPDGIMFANGRSFDSIFEALISPWLARRPAARVLASGMIGSRQGWVEAPYAACPAGFDDLARAMAWTTTARGVRVGFAPGVRAEHAHGTADVMRGEEVQIFGAIASSDISDAVFVLPGTHSKWARVVGGRIVGFHTFMTGELYGVLRRHSILGRLMPEEGDETRLDADAFAQGCAAARRSGAPLHELFAVRTHGLFDRLAAEALPSYMSGLLIGEEACEALALMGAPSGSARLVGRGDLAKRYALALGLFGIETASAGEDLAFQGLHALAGALARMEDQGWEDE
ncbi:2-dehydro-3-deoxygalactonokinase [Methylopila sp. Yamaguchi]|uniref:2-dehydro-3-deoxygalactonokinase n=1 Tax=Methylopila sp. Yamaguchi TaxID=1437817 RepID=UPI000CAC347F|nr:2-dehydro-3-deoxygalactonokinase [Methylopila sp. Yamaguchi]GBD49239.1 2-dehydro-3-deoxygalactonokinase [Methylopila sp. Yamaguchi]